VFQNIDFKIIKIHYHSSSFGALAAFC